MRGSLLAAALMAAAVAGPAAQTAQPRTAGKTLDIYIADTEGGKAALFVTPSGETVLIDSGNPGDRDLTRILEMLNDAGVKKIDHLISTHYHVDHIGGLQELSTRIPIAHYIDHGPSVEPKEQVPGFQAAYEALRGKARHTVVKPGDRVPVAGLDWRIVTSGGEVLKSPLPGGGGPNPACAAFQRRPDPPTPDDNAASVGSVVTFGQFRIVDLGDLLWNKEGELMCPNNPIGTVDLYMVTHHGLANSGSDALVHGVRPRVAIMQNGTRKGGAVAAYEIMRTSPGLEDIWQLHWSHHAGIEHNPAGVFIANVDDAATVASVLTSPAPAGRGAGGRGGAGAGGASAAGGAPGPAAPPAGTPPPPGTPPTPPSQLPPAPTTVTTPGQPLAGAPPAGATPAAGVPASSPGGAPAAAGGGRGAAAAAAAHTPAYYIKVSAQNDGTFTVTNTRNGFSKTYSRRSK